MSTHVNTHVHTGSTKRLRFALCTRSRYRDLVNFIKSRADTTRFDSTSQLAVMRDLQAREAPASSAVHTQEGDENSAGAASAPFLTWGCGGLYGIGLYKIESKLHNAFGPVPHGSGRITDDPGCSRSIVDDAPTSVKTKVQYRCGRQHD